MNHKLANGMKMWRGNGNTTTLLFSLKKLEIVHQEKRRQVKTIVMEHFNGILFHKSGLANKQHTNRPTMISLIWIKTNRKLRLEDIFNIANYMPCNPIGIIDKNKTIIFLEQV
jgi:hypothetical protein